MYDRWKWRRLYLTRQWRVHPIDKVWHTEKWLVIFKEDRVGGRARVTIDEERVLWQGWTEIKSWRYLGWFVVIVCRQQYAAKALLFRSSFRCPFVNTYFMCHDISSLSGNKTGYKFSSCEYELRKRYSGQRSRVKVMTLPGHEQTKSYNDRYMHFNGVASRLTSSFYDHFMKTLDSVKTKVLLGHYTKLKVSQHITNTYPTCWCLLHSVVHL